MGSGAVESWHGSGVKGSSHLALRATNCDIPEPCIILYMFSPLQIKNKPRDGVMKCMFILGPVSMAVNRHSGQQDIIFTSNTFGNGRKGSFGPGKETI